MHFLKVIGLMSVALWADNALYVSQASSPVTQLGWAIRLIDLVFIGISLISLQGICTFTIMVLSLLTEIRANPICSSDSVVFVTVSAPAVTKTVTVPFENGLDTAAVETAPAVSQTPILTDITATLTSYVTFTEFFRIIPATPTLSLSGQAPTFTASHQESVYVAADKGPYYFSEQDGTLVWLDGKTPPATGSFLTSTAFITVQPIPTGLPASAKENAVSTAEGSIVSTSYSTISLYRVSTVYQTKVVTGTIHVPAIPVKAFVSLGSSGWNTSFTPSVRGDENKPSVGISKPIVGQTGAIEKGDNKPKKSTTHPALAYSTNVSEQLEARQVGALVVATIDGVLVSWINSYDGKSTPTPPPNSGRAAYTVPPRALGKWWIWSPSISIELTGLKITEPANLAIYPWDLSLPEPRTTASAPSNISLSTPSKTVALSRFLNLSKSTFSTVTKKTVTSVLSFTPVQPTPFKGPSAAQSSGVSNNLDEPSFCDGEIGAPAEFILTVGISAVQL